MPLKSSFFVFQIELLHKAASSFQFTTDTVVSDIINIYGMFGFA